MAVPNVAGCVLVGYVGAAGKGFAGGSGHAAARQLFSIAAVAFNAYFLAWLAGAAAPGGARAGLAAGGAVVIAAAAAFVPVSVWPLLAAAVYAVSVATFAALGTSSLASVPWQGLRAPADLLWLVPVVAFGFLLCPVLDLTFARARAEARTPHVFGVLGAAFPAMLVLSLLYRDRLDRIAIVPAAHVLAQVVFTAAAHLRELLAGPGCGWRRTGLAVAVALAAVLLAAVGQPGGGDAGYLRLLALFGLVFPAYVLLFVGPGRTLTPSYGALGGFAAVMLACLPFYELGFVRGRVALLELPMAVLVAWKLAILLTGPRAAGRGEAAPRSSGRRGT
jgi:hypothetical protein